MIPAECIRVVRGERTIYGVLHGGAVYTPRCNSAWWNPVIGVRPRSKLLAHPENAQNDGYPDAASQHRGYSVTVSAPCLHGACVIRIALTFMEELQQPACRLPRLFEEQAGYGCSPVGEAPSVAVLVQAVAGGPSLSDEAAY